MKKTIHLAICAIAVSILMSCTAKQEKMENRMKQFISDYETKIIPLSKEANLASWNANITGTDEDYAKSEKASFELAKIYTDSMAFAELKELKESELVKDSLLSRQLDLLYNAYLGGQVDPALLAEQIRIDAKWLPLPALLR